MTRSSEINDPRLAKFVRALTLASQYLVNHPEECWELFAKTHPELNNELNKQAWFATLPRLDLTPAALDHSRYNRLAHFLKQQGLISQVPQTRSLCSSTQLLRVHYG